jgi:predicted nucleic acid-binding Zn ribbon protein
MRNARGFRRGQWRLQRERFRIENPVPPAEARDAVGIANVLPGVMKRLGLEEQHAIGEALQDWESIVGKAVARHTRPGSIRHGRMVVYVDSPVWLSELSRNGKGEMLANLQRHLGSERVNSVAFQADPDAPRTS